jgi:hypothetical protein
MEKYLGTAYTIKELLSLLAEVPNNASTNLGAVMGFGWSSLEVWYDESINAVIFK